MGRPRTAGVKAALIAAAEEILLESGFHALSINAVVVRAKTTRPSFYRRYEGGIPELLLEMLEIRYGSDLHVPDSGALDSDLLAVQREQVRMFGDPLLQRCLPGFLDALQVDAELCRRFVEDFFQLRRTAIRDVVGRAVMRGEIPIPADPEWICDLLTAPLSVRATYPSLDPITDDTAIATTRVALAELQWKGTFAPAPLGG